MRTSKSAHHRLRFWRLGGLASLLPLLFLALFATDGSAQETGQITGVVTDGSTGAPLSEVQVYIEGAQLGSLTRQTGRYLILNVPAGTYEVTAVRVGLANVTQSTTVTAGQTVQLDFAMETQALGLDEIVVTGTAGAARRREVGNSINQINVAELNYEPTQVSDMLLSSAPGIEVTAAGGEVGQGSVIRLRGVNSSEMGSDPIIYIDGVRMRSSALPQAATPDYRAGRGANNTPSPLNMLNPNDIERIEVIKGSAATTLYGTQASAGVIQIFTKRGAQGAPIWTLETQQGTMWNQPFGANGVDYLYIDPWICTGLLSCGDRTHQSWQQMYSASVRGGGEDLQYFVSGEYQDIAGNSPNDYLDKWVVRGNFTFSPLQDVQIQWNTAYSNQWQQNTPTGNNSQGLTLNVFRQDQNYFGSGDPDLISQVLVWDIEQVIERFTSGGTITYSPLSNLTNRLTVGYDYTSQENRNIRPYGFVSFPQGGLNNLTYEFRLLTFDYVGTYSFDLTDAVGSNFSWGGQAVGEDEQSLEAWGEGFPGSLEPTVDAASSTLGFESREKVWTAGFFFQNIFDIADRYFLTAGVRVDGSSTFGTGFGLQVYPKVSGAWVISDESFWPEAAGTLKLRTAYGQSGRAPNAFDAVRTWENTGIAGQGAFTPDNVGNPELGPEVTSEVEVGFDAAWLDGRITADYTFYHQITNDALLNLDQIPSNGFTGAQLTNVGKLKNYGHELALTFMPVATRDWGWDVGLNISTNKSEVLEWVGGDADQRIGYPIQRNFGEIVANPDEIADPDIEEDVYIGPEFPTLFVTPSTTVRFPGGITLSARGEYRGGNVLEVNPISVDRSVRSPLCFPYYQGEGSLDLRADVSALWRARCTPDVAEGYWFDADYFKLRSVSATIPVGFAFPDRVSNATLTLTLGNAYTWMREIPWFDPEVLGNDGATESGLGTTERVPPPTTLRMSLRVTF